MEIMGKTQKGHFNLPALYVRSFSIYRETTINRTPKPDFSVSIIFHIFKQIQNLVNLDAMYFKTPKPKQMYRDI